MKMYRFFNVIVVFTLLLSCNEHKKKVEVQTKVKAEAKTDFKKWAQTPPMGWNSWDCYGPTVTEQDIKANADYMATNLKAYGWEYIVVDIRWYVENTKSHGYNQKDPIYVLDGYGRYMPASNKFPSAKKENGFKDIADYVHRKGLKFGIHLMRGVPKIAVEKKLPVKGTEGITADQIYTTENQCKWLKDNYTIDASKPGAQEYYNSIFELYATWGVDFVKIDDLSAPIYHDQEIELIRNAIDQSGREMVLSTSPGETPISAGPHVSSHANMWRMVNDVWDSWWHITHLMEVSQNWYGYQKEGTWPDCDMIPLGRLSIRGEVGDDRMTHLTKEEQYTLMTFFTIFKSPLFFGGDLPSNDDFTLSLLTNTEVLKMHAESSDVRQLYKDDGKLMLTSQNKKENCTYIALFNTSEEANLAIEVTLADIGLQGKVKITDLWTGENIGGFENVFSKKINSHASGLYKVQTVE
tara:strand:+ start:7044 stop:8441 length:1398 start_codon:yes stop_codon:yes gene_type:complete